ncbi:F-box/LRR-repeat protein At2g42730 [Arabidopsis lyrata subsp. lyrata]|uniref:F-box/LRR-repeat protein At2g42730 n=1 Tax=Arabidopsis lyrata subsp. lyrata TaxID=81972 RepID=UPI000A29B8D5|nr:F-box/LRR-repeat protein At2g42730 [Arabidopsis lyrata subsp. lyrata]|eukprot:XP_020887816.1 F-box/LRR-repeat protein At2g42730 [Arabidopsis lyrata subsp. lyrata]
MDAEDRISRLPDELIGCILSFISTKQAASTSVLSKRWRNVLAFVYNLDLDDHEAKRNRHGGETSKRFTAFVSNLLNLQGGSCLKKVTLKSHVGVRGFLDRAHVQNWICNILDRGVVDLDLVITFLGKIPPVFTLNLMSKTLVKLRLGSREFEFPFANSSLSSQFSPPETSSSPLIFDDFDDSSPESVAPPTVIPSSSCQLENTNLQPVTTTTQPETESPTETLSTEVSSSSTSSDDEQHSDSEIITLPVTTESLPVYGPEPEPLGVDVKLDSLVEARLDHMLYRGGISVTTYGIGVHVDMIHLINAISNVRVLHLSSVFLEVSLLRTSFYILLTFVAQLKEKKKINHLGA